MIKRDLRPVGILLHKKEKPAERELLTAGVEGVDTLDAHSQKVSLKEKTGQRRNCPVLHTI